MFRNRKGVKVGGLLPKVQTFSLATTILLMQMSCGTISFVDEAQHVRGIANTVSSERLDVKTSDGRVVEVRLTPETLFLDHGLSMGARHLKRGDRVDVKLLRLDDLVTADVVRITKPGEGAHSRHASEEQPWREP